MWKKVRLSKKQSIKNNFLSLKKKIFKKFYGNKKKTLTTKKIILETKKVKNEKIRTNLKNK